MNDEPQPDLETYTGVYACHVCGNKSDYSSKTHGWLCRDHKGKAADSQLIISLKFRAYAAGNRGRRCHICGKQGIGIADSGSVCKEHWAAFVNERASMKDDQG